MLHIFLVATGAPKMTHWSMVIWHAENFQLKDIGRHQNKLNGFQHKEKTIFKVIVIPSTLITRRH